jgi:gamma-glutamyl hydrolase
MSTVNGLLLPGGGQNLCDGPYAEAGKFLLERAKLANEEGDYFPVWGTCLGFEQLLIAYTNNCSINTKGWDSEDDAR